MIDRGKPTNFTRIALGRHPFCNPPYGSVIPYRTLFGRLAHKLGPEARESSLWFGFLSRVEDVRMVVVAGDGGLRTTFPPGPVDNLIRYNLKPAKKIVKKITIKRLWLDVICGLRVPSIGLSSLRVVIAKSE